MATIKVRVQGEIATNLTPEVKLVCQNDKYDVEFEFDESWANSNFKTALFIYNGQLIPIPFDGTVCKIPELYDTQLLHIGVKASDVEGLHTTTPARVVCLLSANDLTADEIPAPTPSVYDEIIALLNKYITEGGSADLKEYQKKTDENLQTESKDIVGAINEVKGLAETARMVFGETQGTAYEGNKGKANADNIAKLQNELSIVNATLEQSGLVKKYIQPITQEYNERVTADGANVLDGSKAVLKKVVGSTVACKNLIPFPYSGGKSLSNKGVTFTVQDDGGILVQGTAEETVGFHLFSMDLKMSTYVIVTGHSNVFSITQNGVTFSISGTAKNSVSFEYSAAGKSSYLYVYKGKTANGVVYPMVNYGETAEPYQPYFTGLKSASFAGIESTNADGTETSTLAFPATDCGLGTTIDFENKKITDYGVDLVLTGTEGWGYYKYQTYNGVVCLEICQPFKGGIADYVSTDSVRKSEALHRSGIMWCGYGGDKNFFWLGILDILGFTTEGVEPTAEEKATAISNFKSWLAQRYADGNPVTIRYVSSTLQSESTFTESNEYTAYKGGTEKVLGNDGKEYGADNTLTQDYILVTEV